MLITLVIPSAVQIISGSATRMNGGHREHLGMAKNVCVVFRLTEVSEVKAPCLLSNVNSLQVAGLEPARKLQLPSSGRQGQQEKFRNPADMHQ